MSFPYSIEKNFELEFSENNQFILSDILQQADEKFRLRDAKSIEIKGNTIQFKWRNSLMFFSYPVKIEFEGDKKLKIRYQFELMELIKVLLLVVVFIAFFWQLEISNLFIFISITTFILYFVNVWYIDSQIKRSLLSTAYLSEIWDYNYQLRQKKHSQANCASCGKPLVANVCIWCGKSHKIKHLPTSISVSRYSESQVVYSVRKKQ